MDDTPETTREATDKAPVQLKVAGAVPQIVCDDMTDDLKILLGEFEGPLDLLLHLIRQEQVSIYDIPVARITDEYLRYLRVMQEMDIAVAGDFLVMAATLIELKTRMLLPRDPLADADLSLVGKALAVLLGAAGERPVERLAERPGVSPRRARGRSGPARHASNRKSRFRSCARDARR